MKQGINTVIEDAKKEFANIINKKLQEGLPVSVVNLIIEGIMFELKEGIKLSIEQEKQQYEAQIQLEQEQVEWTEQVECVDAIQVNHLEELTKEETIEE